MSLPRAIILLLAANFILCGCGTGAFFYHPSEKLRETPRASKLIWSEFYVPSTDGNKLHAWLLQGDTSVPAVGTVLHFHGNGGNISYQYKAVVPLVKAGYQAIVFDYQGYGQSEGKAKQERVLDDALAMIDHTLTMPQMEGTKLILFGQSLGGHLAVVAASQRNGQYHALAIEGAFTGHKKIAAEIGRGMLIPRFFTRMIVPSRYNAVDSIAKVEAPVLIIHSSNDEVIPFWMGEELFAQANEPKTFWPIRHPHIEASYHYPKEFVKAFNQLLQHP